MTLKLQLRSTIAVFATLLMLGLYGGAARAASASDTHAPSGQAGSAGDPPAADGRP